MNVKLIARAPLEMIAGADRRPGDTFDCSAEEGDPLVEAGKAERVTTDKGGNGNGKNGKPDKGK